LQINWYIRRHIRYDHMYVLYFLSLKIIIRAKRFVIYFEMLKYYRKSKSSNIFSDKNIQKNAFVNECLITFFCNILKTIENVQFKLS